MELFYSKNRQKNIFVLEGDEASHCVRVLRKREGDIVEVIDGNGSFFRCEIERVVKGKADLVYLRIVEEVKDQSIRDYHLTMAVCPTKNIDRYEWFVEKATEIGIDRIVPFIGEHSIRKEIKKERIQNKILSAVKQSLKSNIPELDVCQSVRDFLQSFDSNYIPSSSEIRMIAHCNEGEKKMIRSILNEYYLEKIKSIDNKRDNNNTNCQNKEKIKITILIGPEGDFSKKEIELAIKKGFIPISLGASRLRVETAALACVCEVYFSADGAI